MTQKILIIRFSSIGDIVLTTPVIRCLKKQVAGVEVHFLTKAKHASILASNPYVDKLHLFDDKILGVIEQLRAEKFDFIIDLHNNIRSNQVRRMLNAKSYSVNKLNIKKFLLVAFKINKLPNIHIVDRYLDTLRAFNVINDGKGLDYFIPEEGRFNTKELPEAFSKGYIAFVLSGTYYTKRLPSEKVLEVCRKTDKPVVLLGGESETVMDAEIMQSANGNVISFCGKLTLSESASLIKEARLVISNDTGLMHIAAAFRKKMLSVWGNTVPEFGMSPYLPHSASEIMQVRGLKCRPCSKLGNHHCPRKHFKCMNDIAVYAIIDWIEENF